jgi:hypothetical protein
VPATTIRIWPAFFSGIASLTLIIWIVGRRVLDPTEVSWLFHDDWPVHFIGWHFFRHDAWQATPGRIDNLMVPIGTALAYTDSIPLVALLLKPVQAALPMAFQYLGVWLAICFFLQGWFGALLASRFSAHGPSVALGGLLFATPPTLSARLVHPALCAHWLILWSIWLYCEVNEGRVRLRQFAILGLVAGLIHPYLALMITTLGLGPLLAPLVAPSPTVRVPTTLVAATLLGLCTTVGWWASGLFSVTALPDLRAGGVYELSMNLLAPITPSGWSSLFPDLPVAHPGQRTEGVQYLGLGLFSLMTLAVGLLVSRRPAHWHRWLPLIATAGLCAVYSAGLRLSIGSHVVWTLSSPELERLLIFRAPARFFWPLLYVALALSLGLLLTRARPRIAAAVLAASIASQLVDVGAAYGREHLRFHAAAFHTWRPPVDADLDALKHYAHMVVYPPLQCEADGLPWMGWAFVAGSNALTINTGYAARIDGEATRSYCANLDAFVRSAAQTDDTLFVVTRARVAQFTALTNAALWCGERSAEIFLCTKPEHVDSWPPGIVQWNRP